LFGILIN